MANNKILIVEDDEAFLSLIKLSLGDMELDVAVAQDGATALTRVSESSFDLIISDFRLPQIHGGEIVRAARAQNNDCQAIIISAADSATIAADLGNIELAGFLQKPLSPIDLRRLVTRALHTS